MDGAAVRHHRRPTALDRPRCAAYRGLRHHRLPLAQGPGSSFRSARFAQINLEHLLAGRAMSPAPGLRNKGQSVVEQVADKRHIPNIFDARARQAAHRARHATGWEPAARNLDARAQKGPHTNAAFHEFQHPAADVLTTPRSAPAPLGATSPRYWLGACLRCECQMWVPTLRPRVPLCETCRSAR